MVETKTWQEPIAEELSGRDFSDEARGLLAQFGYALQVEMMTAVDYGQSPTLLEALVAHRQGKLRLEPTTPSRPTLAPHLHCVYLFGGLWQLLNRDYTIDYAEHLPPDQLQAAIDRLPKGSRSPSRSNPNLPSSLLGASVVFHDCRRVFARWFDGLGSFERLDFCRLGIFTTDRDPDDLLRTEDRGGSVLFVAIDPPDDFVTRCEWCDLCDGVGWHEGATPLGTPCSRCRGTAVRMPGVDAAVQIINTTKEDQ